MRNFSLLSLYVLITVILFSCDTTKQVGSSETTITERTSEQIKPTQIFLVRHAEKSKDDPKDPNLTKEGKERAERLKFHLAKAGITTIYTTDYRRTKQTIQPLADYLDIEPILYTPDLADLPDLLRQAHDGNIVVAGHSNTTPKMVNKLLGIEDYKSLDESIYDHLFVVTKAGDSFSVTLLRY